VYAASALALSVVSVDVAELSADVLSVLLSVLVTPFALTVTEQDRSDPLVDVGRFQVASAVEEVTDSDNCATPFIKRL
jgi:hypothetical protein